MLRQGLRHFSTSRISRDAATCQLLGKFASTPNTFTTKDGKPAVGYLFAVNKGPPENQTASFFNVVSFDERVIERLTVEDLKGAKALVNGSLQIRRLKDDATGTYSESINIRQLSLHIIERSKRSQQPPSEENQAAALEDSFSV